MKQYALLVVTVCCTAAQMLVVRVEGPSYTCRTDEVGEICVSSDGVGNQYWGLPGKTNHTFRVQPLPPPDDTGIPAPPPVEGAPQYVRTGLLGFLGPVSHEAFGVRITNII